MSALKSPAFNFYHRDFLHGTRWWSMEQRGEYITLICEQADSETGSIEPMVFEQIAKNKGVRTKFEEDENGFFNQRLRDELLRKKKYVDSRKQNLDPHKGTENRPLMAIGNRQKAKGNKHSANSKPLIFPFTDEKFISAWQYWKDYKKEQFNFTYRHKGEQAALTIIGDLSDGDLERAIKIIRQSMGNGWKGLFALSESNGPPKTGAEINDYFQRVQKLIDNDAD